jgi:hypothetical protein
MSVRLFTPAQVAALLPKLTALLEAARERHQQATALRRDLLAEQERIQLAGGGLVDQRRWKARAERLDGLGIEVRILLEDLQALGGVTKDLDLGLVDFAGRVDTGLGPEVVNLCWKLGEPAVRFWHRLDEGYAQRKPLP